MDLIEFKRDLGSLITKDEVLKATSVSKEAFMNAAVVGIQENPKILNCTKESLFKSIRRIAAMGLIPDGREAALVPYKAKGGMVCQAMPMVYGLITAVRKSGAVKDIRAHIVYESEIDSGRFVYRAGDEEYLEHHPDLIGPRGKPVLAYAVAVHTDGSIVRAIMDREEIDRVRRAGASQRVWDDAAKKSFVSDTPVGIWKDWAEEMWKKTVIRRLSKRLPMSATDFSQIVSEPDIEDGMKDITPPESTEERLTRIAGEKHEAPVTQEAPPTDILAEDLPEYREEDVFPGDDAFTEGAKAYQDNVPFEANPYAENPEYSNWAGGWNQAQRAKEAK